MNDAKKVNSLAMRSILILIPVFVVPALVAVIVIKKLNIEGAMTLLPIACALLVSWLMVFYMISVTKKMLKSPADSQ